MSENTVDDIRNLYEGIVSNNQETLSEIGNMGGQKALDYSDSYAIVSSLNQQANRAKDAQRQKERFAPSNRAAASAPTASAPYKSRFAGARDSAINKAKGIKGSPIVGKKAPQPGSGPTIAPTANTTARPVAAAARPASAAARPAAPTVTAKVAPSGGDAMSKWRSSNPKLAAASDERARTRGTNQTTNPLMKDMKSSLPAPTKPAVPDKEVKPINSSYTPDEIYDNLLEYFLSTGHANSLKEAAYLVAELDEDQINNIEYIMEGDKKKYKKEVNKKGPIVLAKIQGETEAQKYNQKYPPDLGK